MCFRYFVKPKGRDPHKHGGNADNIFNYPLSIGEAEAIISPVVKSKWRPFEEADMN